MIFGYCCVPELYKGGVMSCDDFMSLTLPRLNVVLKYLAKDTEKKVDDKKDFQLAGVSFAKLQKEARKRLEQQAKDKQDGN